MSPAQKKRFIIYSVFLMVLSLVAGLVMYALSQNMNAYYTPLEILKATEKNPKLLQKNIRLGGMVKAHTLKHHPQLKVEFMVTDYHQDLFVTYQGILPDLFREGQGIVAEGHLLPNNHFKANRILAKHDEKYMPETLKKRIGVDTEWK